MCEVLGLCAVHSSLSVLFVATPGLLALPLGSSSATSTSSSTPVSATPPFTVTASNSVVSSLSHYFVQA